MPTPKRHIRLGVNIDHVATLRNARQGADPDPIKAALLAIDSGAYGITAHLREDRRHIQDKDMENLAQILPAPLNMEMAPTDEMASIATALRPQACCLVPEKRQELTTEGGLNVAAHRKQLHSLIAHLRPAGIKISLFIDPNPKAIEMASNLGADAVELHTGDYASHPDDQRYMALKRAAKLAHRYGLDVHAGHGLTEDNVAPIAAIGEVTELNIGHALIAQAIFVGLPNAIARMQHSIRVGIEKNYD